MLVDRYTLPYTAIAQLKTGCLNMGNVCESIAREKSTGYTVTLFHSKPTPVPNGMTVGDV